MLPPRYLLRENVVVRLLRELGPSQVAEIGCGAGDLLVRLAAEGHSGTGYDRSSKAREHARRRLAEAGIRAFSISDDWPARGAFDAVLLLEVLGYLEDPVETLRRCRELLRPGGHLIVSYAKVGAGYDSRVVAGMKFFDKLEVGTLLEASGFVDVHQQNYGFPLANALVGANNAFYKLRLRLRGASLAVGETGLVNTARWLRPLALVSNRVTLQPFFAAQRLTAESDLGNGYVASAKVPP